MVGVPGSVVLENSIYSCQNYILTRGCWYRLCIAQFVHAFSFGGLGSAFWFSFFPQSFCSRAALKRTFSAHHCHLGQPH